MQVKRGLLLLVLSTAAACATAHPQKRTFSVVSPSDVGFVEDEAEMDITIPAFNPLTGAGIADQINAHFRGVDRKGPKISIVSASLEDFNDIVALIDTLPDDDEMLNHDPEIARDTMTRADEEKRNVRVPAWIYAIKYEADQDWHVIIGTRPSGATKTFFNAEVSGLPPSSSSTFAKLLKVRKSLASILADDLPSGSGYSKYDDPIPVVVEGSLFFDVDHAAGVVGPAGMRPATAWEIHPVTKLSVQ